MTERNDPPPQLPLERYAKLDLEGVPDGASIYFCADCDYQRAHGDVGVSDCPQGHDNLRFVVNNAKLRETLEKIRERVSPKRWEEAYSAMMVALAQRRAKLPQDVQQIISDSLTNAGPKIKALAKGQDFEDDEWSRRLRELYLHTLGGLIQVAEAMATHKSRIILPH